MYFHMIKAIVSQVELFTLCRHIRMFYGLQTRFEHQIRFTTITESWSAHGTCNARYFHSIAIGRCVSYLGYTHFHTLVYGDDPSIVLFTVDSVKCMQFKNVIVFVIRLCLYWRNSLSTMDGRAMNCCWTNDRKTIYRFSTNVFSIHTYMRSTRTEYSCCESQGKKIQTHKILFTTPPLAMDLCAWNLCEKSFMRSISLHSSFFLQFCGAHAVNFSI